MNTYWRIAGLVKRIIPHAWLRAWSMQAQKDDGYIPVKIDRKAHFVMVPMRPLTITADGRETFNVVMHDLVNVTMAKADATLLVHAKEFEANSARRN